MAQVPLHAAPANPQPLMFVALCRQGGAKCRTGTSGSRLRLRHRPMPQLMLHNHHHHYHHHHQQQQQPQPPSPPSLTWCGAASCRRAPSAPNRATHCMYKLPLLSNAARHCDTRRRPRYDEALYDVRCTMMSLIQKDGERVLHVTPCTSHLTRHTSQLACNRQIPHMQQALSSSRTPGFLLKLQLQTPNLFALNLNPISSPLSLSHSIFFSPAAPLSRIRRASHRPYVLRTAAA
jgi:hypothetical protein